MLGYPNKETSSLPPAFLYAMDIFQDILPKGCTPPSLYSIPYVGSLEFDNETFRDYPARVGYAMSVNGILQFGPDVEYEHNTCLLQSWLFFGLIATMLDQEGLVFDRQTLISQNALDRPRVDCSALRPIIDTWYSQAGESLQRERSALHLKFYLDTLRVAQRNLKSFDLDMEKNERLNASRERALVVLSVKCCIRAFLIMLQRHHKHDMDDKFVIVEECDYISPSGAIAREYLIKHGWCPTHTSDLLRRLNIEEVYIAAAVRGHFAAYCNHSLCNTQQGCVALSVNNKEFKPLHTSQDCRCLVTAPNMCDVRSIIEEGHVPVVEVWRDQIGVLHLNVKAVDADTEYTAISHVWSQGLADPRINGLYHCQLSRLIEDIIGVLSKGSGAPKRTRHRTTTGEYSWKTTEEPITLWLDALCIPCFDPDNPVESLALKRKAIQLMTPVYAGASQVLVLDKSLEAVDYRLANTDLLQAADRAFHYWLSFSPWMTRCWTLQEGALAKRLFVRAGRNPGEVKQVEHRYLNLRRGKEKFLACVENLTNRDSSEKADILQILANLCSLNASELAALPDNIRAKALLRSQAPAFPFSLLLRKLQSSSLVRRDEMWIPNFESKLRFRRSETTNTTLDDEAPEIILMSVGKVVFTARRLEDLRKGWVQEPTFVLRLRYRRRLDTDVGIWDTVSSRKDKLVMLGHGLLFPVLGFHGRLRKKIQLTNLARLLEPVLHDDGIVFDASSLGFIAIPMNHYVPKTFVLYVAGRVFWVSLDLDLETFKSSTNGDQSILLGIHRIWIFLQLDKEPLNAQGLCGRGLCLIQRQEQETILIPKALRKHTPEKTWHVQPTTFGSALTYGLATSSNQNTFSRAPQVQSVPISPSPQPGGEFRFCIAADVKSWPVLKTARDEKTIRINTFLDDPLLAVLVIGVMPPILLGAFFLAMSFIKTVSRWLGLITALVFILFVPFLLYTVIVAKTYRRRRIYRLWVQSFRETSAAERDKRARQGAGWKMLSSFSELGDLIFPWRPTLRGQARLWRNVVRTVKENFWRLGRELGPSGLARGLQGYEMLPINRSLDTNGIELVDETRQGTDQE
jgi:hypothetical protein